MSKMLNMAKGCKASHEHLMKFCRQNEAEGMANLAPGAMASVERVWLQRALAILQENRDTAYIDSDARFSNMYYWLAARDIDHKRLRVIMLKRDKARIAFGNCKAGGYRKIGDCRIHVHTLVYPYGKANVTVPMKDYWKTTPMELAAWGVYETLERQRRFKEVFPDIPTMDWDMDEDAGSMGSWYDLLDFLGLSMTRCLAEAIRRNKRINSTFCKPARSPECTLEEAVRCVTVHQVKLNPIPRPKGFL